MAIDPVLVGGYPLEDVSLPEPNLPASAPKLTQEQAASAGVVPGPSANSNAAMQAELEREKATPLQSFGAAASQWGVQHIYDVLTKPRFDVESPATFNIRDNFSQLEFVPTDAQHKILNGTQSRAEFWWYAEHMKVSNTAAQAMQDNPRTAFLGGMIDPAYIVVDAIAPGAGRALSAGRAGRVGATAISGGAAAGMGLAEQSVLGTETQDIIINSALNAAITNAVYNRMTRKLEPLDSKYPAQELDRVAQEYATTSGYVRRLDEEGNPVIRNGKEVWTPVPKDTPQAMAETAGIMNESSALRSPILDERPNFVAGEMSAVDALRRVESNPLAAAMLERAGAMLDNVKVRVIPKEKLPGGADASFRIADDTIFVHADSRPNSLTHEVTHALTVHKIEYGLKNPNSTHGKIVNEIANILDRAKEFAEDLGDTTKRTQYYLGNLHEFTAGLFSGNIEFTRMLSKMPDVYTGGNLLGTLVNGIRRLLGLKPSEQSALTRAMALTDDLIAAPQVERISAKDLYYLNEFTDAKGVQTFMEKWSAKELGRKLEWSLSHSLGRFSEGAKKIADRIWDDPVNMAGDSVESQKRAIMADLRPFQIQYEEAMLDAMQARGASLWARVFKPREAKAVESQISRQVATVLARREHYTRLGLEVPPNLAMPEDIVRIADKHDAMMKYALSELKSAGVEGAEQIAEANGYFQRRWDVTKMEDILRKLQSVDGFSEAQAMKQLKRLVSRAVQKANGWEDELASDVGGAIVDRTFRKGYGEDQPFLANFGKMTVAQVRDVLSQGGVHGDRLQRALDVMTGAIDEAGKQPMLKHRVDMDLDTTLQHRDGSTSGVLDMWDTNLTRLAEHYIEVTAAQAALARKGLKSSTDIAQARTEYLHSIEGEFDRKEAAALWDKGMAQIQGQPVGEDMHRAWRMTQAVNQAITLGFSGLWQVTEIGNLVGKYGLNKTVGAMFNQLPGSRELYGMAQADRAAAKHLADILQRNSAQDIRLRPYVQKLEDNFDIPVTDAMQLGLSQVQQLVPYVNAMKFVTSYQARISANLVVDVFDRAVRGDAKAIAELEKYGFKRPLLEDIKSDVTASMNTADWSDGTWEAVRGPLTKMMDECVLRSRSGEIPAFVQHTSAGKVLFTYRNFVLAAHNKVLAGTLNREGYQGVALIAMYQFPLTVLATAAHNGMTGKKQMEPDELIAKSIGQMGVMGLLSEAWGIATGDKTRVNIPATIPFDRVYNIGGAVARGDGDGALKGAIASIPIIGVVPGVKALTSKED